MSNELLPNAQSPVVDSSGQATREWRNYFAQLSTIDADQLQNEIDALTKQVNAIPGGFTLKAYDSIAMRGNPTAGGLVQLSLVGDTDTPLPLSFYGSVNANDAGWHNFSDNFAATMGLLDLSDTGVTSGTYGDATHIPVTTFDTKGRATEVTLVPIASGGSSLNYLINGWLQHWQRGTTFTADGDGIGPDGFSTFFAGATCATSRVLCPPDTFDGDPHWLAQYVVTAGSSDTDFCQIYQLMEDVRTLAGRTVTFVLQVKASVNCSISMELFQYFGVGAGSVSGIGSTKTALVGGVVQTIAITVDIPAIPSSAVFGTAKTDYLAAVIWLDAGDYYASRSVSLGHQSATFQIGTLAIVDGSSVKMDRPDEASELVRCQRFFEKSFPHGTTPAQNAGKNGAVYAAQVVGASTVSAVSPVPFKVTKRVAPAVVIYNPSAANAQVRNDTLGTDWTSSVTAYIEDSGFGVHGTSAASSAAGNVSLFHWTASASLAGVAVANPIVLSPDGVQGFITDTGAILIP